MKLLTKDIERQLDRNAALAAAGKSTSPVLKLFVPWGAATWLISERDPEEPDRLFGLCDLGMGSPELGYVSLSEIASVRGPGGLTIERDQWFKADKPLTEYADEARAAGGIMA